MNERRLLAALGEGGCEAVAVGGRTAEGRERGASGRRCGGCSRVVVVGDDELGAEEVVEK